MVIAGKNHLCLEGIIFKIFCLILKNLLHKYKKDFTFAAAFEISNIILMAPWLNWIEHLTTDQKTLIFVYITV
ncbi:MAG: hypothetical protein DWQ02_25210 [Bacteroidetes bacterium]|nr:MAG: hypothetical protein DWQ02_25210 [Bacteroidota bacterium]